MTRGPGYSVDSIAFFFHCHSSFCAIVGRSNFLCGRHRLRESRPLALRAAVPGVCLGVWHMDCGQLPTWSQLHLHLHLQLDGHVLSWTPTTSTSTWHTNNGPAIAPGLTGFAPPTHGRRCSNRRQRNDTRGFSLKRRACSPAQLCTWLPEDAAKKRTLLIRH
jgi:hypothetical protein